MVTEGKDLLPHILVLCDGQMQKATTKFNAYKAPAIPKEKDEAAAKAVYRWLQSRNSTIRSVLKLLAKGGLWYIVSRAKNFPGRSYRASLFLGRNCWPYDFIVYAHVALESEASEDGATDWASMKKRKR